MKINFTDRELKILTNFSKINANILFKKDDEYFRTINTYQNIFAEFKTGRKFTKEFGITDLSEFLSYIDLFDEPQFEYKHTKGGIEIKDRNKHLFYPCADPKTLVFPRKLFIPKDYNPVAEFDFKSENFEMNKFLKTKHSPPDLVFFCENGEIKFQCLDKRNFYQTKFTINLKQKTNRNFKIFLKAENLKIFESDYKVKLFKEKISEWENKHIPLKYYIALEHGSEFAW